MSAPVLFLARLDQQELNLEFVDGLIRAGADHETTLAAVRLLKADARGIRELAESALNIARPVATPTNHLSLRAEGGTR